MGKVRVIHMSNLEFVERKNIPEDLKQESLGPWFVIVGNSIQGRYMTEQQAEKAAQDLEAYFN